MTLLTDTLAAEMNLYVRPEFFQRSERLVEANTALDFHRFGGLDNGVAAGKVFFIRLHEEVHSADLAEEAVQALGEDRSRQNFRLWIVVLEAVISSQVVLQRLEGV